MDTASHFISNLGDILSQQSSILDDKSLWILQSLRGIIFLELPNRNAVNWKH